MTATADLNSPSMGASHHMVIWKAFKEQKNEKRDLPIGGATYQKYYAYDIELPQLVGGLCYDFSPYL